jgi:hypothetical protein
LPSMSGRDVEQSTAAAASEIASLTLSDA